MERQAAPGCASPRSRTTAGTSSVPITFANSPWRLPKAVLETSGLATAKPGFIDRVIHRNSLGSGADELVTFEKAAAKLPKLRVLNGDSSPERQRTDGDPAEPGTS